MVVVVLSVIVSPIKIKLKVVAHRARQIAAEAEEFNEELPEKPVTLAIREVADGKLSASLKDEYMN